MLLPELKNVVSAAVLLNSCKLLSPGTVAKSGLELSPPPVVGLP